MEDVNLHLTKDVVKKNGRPWDYREEFVEQVVHYALNYDKEPWCDAIPQKAALSLMFQVSRPTIDNWCNQYPEFGHVVTLMMSVQERTLLNCLLKKTYEQNTGKMILAQSHGYKDIPTRQEITYPQSVNFTIKSE